ncbi:unnamed protein product, partial [Soboliphyme baturini]|uniref:PA28_beta domain-containing protein n=1 Tax=Soboliphyme baturini TaxID=241478 RepID=A0A183IR88_9BILA
MEIDQLINVRVIDDWISLSRTIWIPVFNLAGYRTSRLKSMSRFLTSLARVIMSCPLHVLKFSGTKVMAFINGVVSSNSHIIEMTEIVKPVVREAVESVNKVKMWILFLIPRIEDGNNFGVSIQEDTLSEVRTVEAEAASFLDQISRYLVARGKLVSKVAKYPHVEDYRKAIVDLDEKEFINLRLVLMEVRNHYVSAYLLVLHFLFKVSKSFRDESKSHK